MVLLLLLLVPVLIGLAGLLASKGSKITVKEFAVLEGVVIVVVVAGYLLALSSRSSDTEIWNGTIARKWQGTESCCHSYPCNCHEVCSGSGKDRSCSELCDTCYEHSHDIDWNAISTNNETVYYDGCNRPGSSAPGRWNQIVVGEPTAVEHSYTNYIKGNPDSILRRQGYAEKFKGKIPGYPQVYDHYRDDTFLPIGVSVPDRKWVSDALSALNGLFGTAKQVNIILVAVDVGDPSYAEALRESWLGGKKNDVVVVVGMPHFPEIGWASVISWSKSEDMKIEIRDRLLALKNWDCCSVVGVLQQEVGNRFVRRRWKDFDYLKSTIEPTESMQWTLGLLGLLLSLGLSVYFWIYDPFNSVPLPRMGRAFRPPTDNLSSRRFR
jgi:hypothetical protein